LRGREERPRGELASGPGTGSFGVSSQAMTGAKVRVRRVYEEPERSDGTRVLVDRIWPRGLTKAKAALDGWCEDVAPSNLATTLNDISSIGSFVLGASTFSFLYNIRRRI
jgi:hypothetical protein